MPKQCKFEGCKWNVWGHGYCYDHRNLAPKKEKRTNDRGLFVREKEKVATDIPTAYQLDKWFKERYKDMPDYCENCKTNKTYKNHARWKWSIAHILPKSPTNGCPSVSCHEYNCMYLCASCHQNWDYAWSKAMQMPIWETAKIKVQTFLHLVKEKRKFLEHFK